MPILYCARCGTGYGSVGEVPLKCPACDRVTSWKQDPFWPPRATDTPTVPWALTFNDCRLLRSLRIDPGISEELQDS